MSYQSSHRHASVFYGVGALAGVNDKVGRGDDVVLRFTPGRGVNATTGQRVIDALKKGVMGTSHFDTPSVATWGAGTNRGLLVIKAETRSDNYTLQQIADFMPNIARNASVASGLPVTFASASSEGGDEAFARSTGGSSSGGGSSPGGGGGGGRTSPAPGGAFVGLTSGQVTQWSLLDRITRQNTDETARVFGSGEPELSFRQVLDFDFRSFVRASAPVRMLRSLMLYAVAQNAKALLALPGLMRAQNDGSAQAAQMVEEISRDLRESNDRIAQVLAKVREYLPRASGVSGLGALPAALAAIWGSLTAAQVAAIIAGVVVLVVGIHWYLKNMTTNVERAEEFCAARERITGKKCTPADFRAYVESLDPDATQMIARTGKQMTEGAGMATKVLLVGGAAIALAYFGFRVFQSTGGWDRMKAKTSAAATRVQISATTLRDRARARLGGASSSPRRLTASSESFST